MRLLDKDASLRCWAAGIMLPGRHCKEIGPSRCLLRHVACSTGERPGNFSQRAPTDSRCAAIASMLQTDPAERHMLDGPTEAPGRLWLAGWNRRVGWVSTCLGAATGLILGLWSFDGPFAVPGWLGAYDQTGRRLARLGHIAFFGLGILNILV